MIIDIETTMKIPNQGKNFQSKKSSKSSRTKGRHAPVRELEEINSDDILSEPQQHIDHEQEQYKTAEQVKIELAKKLIQKAKMSLTKNKDKKILENEERRDDFFIVDQNEDGKNEAKIKNAQDEEYMTQVLKTEYLKSKNRLYSDRSEKYSKYSISQESIAYKGHTKCITGIAVTPEHIFSCSKDMSIIKWDREKIVKDFITKGEKRELDHSGPILSLGYHEMHQMVASAGEDGLIKLWDVRGNRLIHTLKGHRSAINGVKFGLNNSNNLCSVSGDRTLKQWDCAQRGIIETYYGHNNEILDIDAINENDFVTSGNDHQNIIWRTQKQTQVIFEGHEYAIDRVRSINEERFISASQDGAINLWFHKKKKPIYKHHGAHESWITALDTIKQSNIAASGGCEGLIKIWAIDQQNRAFNQIHEVRSKGIVTDVKISQKQVIATACDEHRLGRWITRNCRNQIEVFKFISKE